MYISGRHRSGPSCRSYLGMLLAAFTVLACLPFASADYVRINESNPDDLMDVHIYRLDNGLLVYLT